MLGFPVRNGSPVINADQRVVRRYADVGSCMERREQFHCRASGDGMDDWEEVPHADDVPAAGPRNPARPLAG